METVMKAQRVALAVTGINLLLLVYLVGQTQQAAVAEEGAGKAGVAPVLRARTLEIVDDQERVRALLAVMPPAVVDGKQYPETVLLRLIDPTSGPVVKLSAAANGSALMLSDDADGGVKIFVRDGGSYLKVVSKEGKEQVVQP